MICQYDNTAQQTQNICITFVQYWSNVDDGEPALYKCYTNALCLLGNQNQLVHLFNWSTGGGPGAVAKATCLESRRSRARPPTPVFKETNVSFSLTRNDSEL